MSGDVTGKNRAGTWKKEMGNAGRTQVGLSYSKITVHLGMESTVVVVSSCACKCVGITLT